ncbi:hypothetical protein AAFC00_000060 [Neodothiora populina]|uniref:Uncharacterized protein n=1 Tax=Neodothiora populina TaxID=2781224 RepID=A0ABR3P1F8_9PEZI
MPSLSRLWSRSGRPKSMQVPQPTSTPPNEEASQSASSSTEERALQPTSSSTEKEAPHAASSSTEAEALRTAASPNEKEEAISQPSSTSAGEEAPPPPYTKHVLGVEVDDDEEAAAPAVAAIQPANLTAGFANLDLNDNKPEVTPRLTGFVNPKSNPDRNQTTPLPDECIAHLKLLECFYRLRQSIGSANGLFGIPDPEGAYAAPAQRPSTIKPHGITEIANIRAVISEKRWQIYVSRAVSRFDRWINSLDPPGEYLHRAEMSWAHIDNVLAKGWSEGMAPVVHAGNLPPIDILMVWHSYMLNPRAYYEDCNRQGRLPLWHSPMPWDAVAKSITNGDFAYQPEVSIPKAFEARVGINWNNIDDPADAHVLCPGCQHANRIPWTTCTDSESINAVWAPSDASLLFARGTGYGDKGFVTVCQGCKQSFNHDVLSAGKFLEDVRLLIHKDVIMRGTFLNQEGLPETTTIGKTPNKLTDYLDKKLSATSYPDRLIRSGWGQQLLDKFAAGQDLTMDSIRAQVEQAVHEGNRDWKKTAIIRCRPSQEERIAIRRMMSRYWDNWSPFALDLVGAVIRQGAFVEKMHKIDWLHSPALPATMGRLIVKYTRFVYIMRDKKNMAVPTLDVDLAWHTHQLHPSAYMNYTIRWTSQLIDHDDKVSETKLSDAFAWTSRTYQDMYNEPYSECTCWYCEAIRESHTSVKSRLFRTSSATISDSIRGESRDPNKSVHISAHNAVRVADQSQKTTDYARAKERELDEHFRKSCRRADKKRRERPRREDFYYSDAWGYPVYLPAMMPFYGMSYYNSCMYPANPGCIALGAGAAGNCCKGTCGGNIAAGGSACAAANFAACGGGDGGVGGSSSGGGCGGGGGGGGCGGGGGGGGGCGGGGC